MEQLLDTTKFYIVGNNLCVDFVNTQIRENGAPKELLESFENFVVWALKAGLLDLSQANSLIKDWNGRPRTAQLFKRVLEFREVLREMIVDILQGTTIKLSGLDAINLIMKEENSYAEVVRMEGGFEKRFHADFNNPGRLLAPIAEAAADLLCYGNPTYLRKCENPECVLYFYDVTKNHGRRWCSMTVCGNRAKAAAFYQRQAKARK